MNGHNHIKFVEYPRGCWLRLLTNSHLDAVFLWKWPKVVLAFLTTHYGIVMFKSPDLLGLYAVSSVYQALGK